MKKLLSLLVLSFPLAFLYGQTLPVGTPVLEDYYRREQLLGKVDSNISFMVRPLTAEALKRYDIFHDLVDTSGEHVKNAGEIHYGQKSFQFKILPFTWIQQYNSKRPYGWNDGAMIPARGYQTLVSGGAFFKYRCLNFQIRPEAVYAQNQDFSPFPLNFVYDYDPFIDLPARFGEKHLLHVLPGQSRIQVSLGPVSIAASTENLWWGPGLDNSILMSNNAPGFKHISISTFKPVKTSIGSFEAQIIGGRLDGSGFVAKPVDWRYLSGVAAVFQPKYIPGLFFGFARSVQAFHNRLNSLTDYIPFLQSFEEDNSSLGLSDEDQLVSFFSRWIFPAAKAEMYFEFARGDHAGTVRDFILQPEHSRGYQFGFNKLIGSKSQGHVELKLELTHLQQTLNYVVRSEGSFYLHSGVSYGYTHIGQILGAGIANMGPGGNAGQISFSWIKKMNSVGFLFQNQRFTNDFFIYLDPSNQRVYWGNSNMGVITSFRKGGYLFNLKAIGIRASYEDRSKPDFYYTHSQDHFNVHVRGGMTYIF